MRILISTAWDIDWDHSNEMVAGSKWLDSTYVDILAKGFHRHQRTGAPGGSDFIGDDLRLMLRALLIDRFRITAHYEDKPVPTPCLVSVKPKMKRQTRFNR